MEKAEGGKREREEKEDELREGDEFITLFCACPQTKQNAGQL